MGDPNLRRSHARWVVGLVGLFAVAAAILWFVLDDGGSRISAFLTKPPPPRSTVSQVASPGTSATASPSPSSGVFTLTAVRARQVSTVVRMVDAYNVGRLDQMLLVLEDRVGWSDCDYKNVALVDLAGKAAVTSYLRHDLPITIMWTSALPGTRIPILLVVT